LSALQVVCPPLNTINRKNQYKPPCNDNIKNTLSLFGEEPMERNQKTLRKPKKNNKKNIWKLLVGPPHPQDLWNIVFLFSQKNLHFWPENPKTSRKPKKKQKTIFGNSWWDPPIL